MASSYESRSRINRVPPSFASGDVKEFPKPPPNVAIAFERLQVPGLIEKLHGPDEQKKEAIDTLLHLWLHAVNSEFALKQGILEILIFLLRSSGGTDLRTKLSAALAKLATVANGRTELVGNPQHLADIRSSTGDDKSVKLNILDLAISVSRSVAGAAALVHAGYWPWLVEMSENEADAEVKTSVYRALSLIKANCNSSDTDVPKATLKRLTDSDLTSPSFGTYCLDFAIALCRLDGNKREFVALGAIKKVNAAFVDPFLKTDSTAPDHDEKLALAAKALQFFGSLALIVAGKNEIHEAELHYTIFKDARVVLHPTLGRTSLPFALTLVEHPGLREDMKNNEILTPVNRVRKARDDARRRAAAAEKHSEEVSMIRDPETGKLLGKLPMPSEEMDGFIEKMSVKLLDGIFWEP